MKTNVGIDLSNWERSVLADVLDGNVTKRLITRREVSDLVTGFVEALIAVAEDAETDEHELPRLSPLTPQTPYQRKLVDRWRAEGRSDGFIRGGLQVVRSIGK